MFIYSYVHIFTYSYYSKKLKNETAWEIQFCSFYHIKDDCCMNIIGFFYNLCIIISKTNKKGVISSKTYASRIFHDQGTYQLIDQGNFPWRMHLKFAGEKVPVFRMQFGGFNPLERYATVKLDHFPNFRDGWQEPRVSLRNLSPA